MGGSHAQLASHLVRKGQRLPSLKALLNQYRNESCSSIQKMNISSHMRILHDRSGNGIGPEVFLIGDSTLRNKFEYLAKQEYHQNCKSIPYPPRTLAKFKSICTHVFGVRYYYEAAMTARHLKDAVKHLEEYWLSSQGSLFIIFNVGLHELHLFPARNTPMDLRLVENLQESVACLRNISEGRQGHTQVGVKLTNHICSEKFTGAYAKYLDEWHNNATAARKMCLQDIVKRFPAASSVIEIREMSYYLCETMVFDNVGVHSINGLLLDAVKETDFFILDSYELTRWFCHCSGEGDGRHYPSTVPLWWLSTLSTISSARVHHNE